MVMENKCIKIPNRNNKFKTNIPLLVHETTIGSQQKMRSKRMSGSVNFFFILAYEQCFKGKRLPLSDILLRKVPTAQS